MQVRPLFPVFHPKPAMNELIQRLTALGLSEDMAKQAIQTVGEFIKSKVPEDYQPMVDQVLAGQSPDLGKLGGILGQLKGFFGGDK